MWDIVQVMSNKGWSRGPMWTAGLFFRKGGRQALPDWGRMQTAGRYSEIRLRQKSHLIVATLVTVAMYYVKRYVV